MRDILFRAKRLDNGKWIYGGYFKHDAVKVCFTSDDPHTKHCMIRDGFCDWGFEPPLEYCEVDPKTVGQSTSLTDKNSTPIFSDDIIECWSEGVRSIGVVQQRVDGLWIIYPSFQDNIMWGLCPNTHGQCNVEIIGNVYDNPELLEGVTHVR